MAPHRVFFKLGLTCCAVAFAMAGAAHAFTVDADLPAGNVVVARHAAASGKAAGAAVREHPVRLSVSGGLRHEHRKQDIGCN